MDFNRRKKVVIATLVAIGYADQGVAEDARKSIQELEDELTIQADRVASIVRDVEGRFHAHISHGGAPAGGGVDWGGFWGPLFGMLFSIPANGLSVGARSDVLRGPFGEKGLDKGFRDQIREQVKPGTSAVFMVIEHAPPDKAVGALARYGGTMIKTALSNTGLERLREALRPPASTDVLA